MSAKALRVLQVSRSVIQGGFDYHAEIARGFKERGADVCTVFLRGHMPDVGKRAFPGKVVCLDAERRKILKNKSWFALALWEASRGKPQHLAICHHLTPAQAVHMLLRLGHIRTAVLVIHDYDYFDPLDKHGARRKRVVERLIRYPWRLVAVSHAICTNIQTQVAAIPPECCQVIHNAIDTNALEQRLLTRSEARQALGLGTKDFVFGTVGRLVAFKAHAELIDAFARVHQSMPRAKLIIIGRGPLESQLRRQVDSSGLKDRVLLHGFLDDAARYIKAFDVFVLPSHHEPFGLVLLEAMTGRVPVLASDSGATSEILPSADALFPTGNPAILAERLLEIYGNEPSQLEAMGLTGYEHALRYFSLVRYRAAYASLLGPEINEDSGA